jgi:acetyl-CoA carboxylase alpha subunit
MTNQARIEAEIEAAKKAAETAAVKTTAEIDAANKANARITAQYNLDLRKWNAKSPANRPPKPTLNLVPVPEMPAAYKEPRRGPVNRLAAGTGRAGMAYPKTAKLISGALALSGIAAAALLYYNITKETVIQTTNIASDAVQRELDKINLQKELFKRASQMTDPELAELLLKNPEKYLQWAQIEMEHCSGHPNEPICKTRMAKLCADQTLTALNGGPLAGCRAFQATANQ